MHMPGQDEIMPLKANMKGPMEKLKLRALLASLLLGSCLAASAADPVDLNPMIKAKLASGSTALTLPPGEIRISKTINLSKLKEFSIDGAPEGSHLVFETGSSPGIAIRDSGTISLKGFSIDFAPLPFTQGTALSVSGKQLKVKLHAGYPKPPRQENLAMHAFDPATRLWKSGAPDFFGVSVVPDGDSGECTVKSPSPLEGVIAPGDLLAFDWRGNEGMHIRTTKSLTMEDIDIYSSPSLGIGGRNITGQHVFRRVRIMRGPTPAGATEPRLLSTSADGFNYATCVKGPIIEDCDFSFMGDDGVNLHGIIVPVAEQESPSSILIIRPYKGELLPEAIAPGMKARFLKPGNFEISGFAEIASFERVENKLPPETAGLFYPLFKNSKAKPPSDVYRMTFKGELKGDMKGFYLDIPDINCPGFVIRNSKFHDHRARGLRLQAAGGIVENCSFERISQNAITLGPEYGFWREAGWISDITIRNNRISDVCRGFIALQPACYGLGAIAAIVRPDQVEMELKPGNRNLTIEGNRIENCPLPGIFLNGVDGASVSGNTLKNVCKGAIDKSGSAWRLRPTKPIDSANSANLTIKDNTEE